MENLRLKRLSEEWLVEVTIDQIQEKLQNSEVTSYELVLMYLDRIASFDQDGPKINSILEVNPEALQIATALDFERKTKGTRGPLHGIPVIVKDNIDTCDKMHTSAGSLALKDSYALNDSHVAKCLKEAGAIILAKANMTEWANFMTDHMPSGYSSRGGQVLNPYGPGKFDVGGSSSGSGASIASNFATVAVGTETSGSILSPASQNSLVGIKPTVGLVSRRGIIPISHSQDTAGPMARTVKDAAYLINCLNKIDEKDPVTLTNPLQNVDFTEVLKPNGLQGMNLGIARKGYFDYLDDEKKELLEQAILKLKEIGAIINDSVVIPSSDEKWSYDVLVYEFKSDLNAYLSQLAPNVLVRTLSDLVLFNQEHKDQMLKYGQTILLESENTLGTLTERSYLDALEKDIYLSREKGIDQLLKEEGLDAIVFPNNFGAGIPAKAGYPSITVPCGYTKDGEPVGITFTGLAYSEPKLIQIAYAFEQATKHRIPPKF